MQVPRLLVVACDASKLLALREDEFAISTVISLEEAQKTAPAAFNAIIAKVSPSDGAVLDFFPLKVPFIAVCDSPDEIFALRLLKAGVFALVSDMEINKVRRLLDVATKMERGEEQLQIVSAVPSWIELIVPALPPYIIGLSSFFRHFISKALKGESDKILNAFRELLQNAIEHGSSFCREKKVFIRYLKSQRFISFQIEDQGPGFDREALPHAALGSGKNAAREAMRYRRQFGMRPGGLGICYALGAADELIYNEKGNAVTMIKYLEKPDKECR